MEKKSKVGNGEKKAPKTVKKTNDRPNIRGNDLISKTEAVKLNNLFESFPAGKIVAISGHLNPADSDMLGSSDEFRKFLWAKYKIEAHIFKMGPVSHPINKELKTACQMDEFLKDAEYFNEHRGDYALRITCDTQPENAALRGENFDVIIDHHKNGGDHKKCINLTKRVGACATVLWHIFDALGYKLDQAGATSLAVAIATDTGHLVKDSESTKYDEKVMAELMTIADYKEFARICICWTKPKSLVNALFPNAVIEGTTIVISAGELTEGQSDNMAFMADIAEASDAYDLVAVVAVIDGIKRMVKLRSEKKLLDEDGFCKKCFGSGDVTEDGETARAGGKTGAGGAVQPMTRFERKMWETAKERGNTDVHFKNMQFTVLKEIKRELEDQGVE